MYHPIEESAHPHDIWEAIQNGILVEKWNDDKKQWEVNHEDIRFQDIEIGYWRILK